MASWGASETLPLFKRVETWKGDADDWRGGDGPVGVQFCAYADPLVDAFAATGRAAGGWSEDYNGEHQEGFAQLQMSIKDGRRSSSATAYLRPALKRGNLKVVTGALATRIALAGGWATGIEYTRKGVRHTAHVARSVILCGGVINTPQLLMISGIGAPDQLATHGIEAKVALPGVGANLQDHASIILMYHRSAPGPFHAKMRYDKIVPDLARTWLTGRGFSSDVPGGVTAFLRSSLATDTPDMQILFTAAPLAPWPWMPPFRAPFTDGFATRLVLTRPESRGAVTLTSADPHTAPAIRQNFLSTDHDWQVLREGFALARIWPRRPRCNPSSRPRSHPAPPAPTGTGSTRTSAIRRSRCTTRQGPAAWAPAIWRW